MTKIKLVDAIAELRRELYKANKAGAGEELKLEIEAVDVEFEVELEMSRLIGLHCWRWRSRLIQPMNARCLSASPPKLS